MMGRRIVLLALLHAIFLFGKIDAANAFVACRSLLDRTVPPATSLNAKNVPNLVASSLVASSIMIGTASFNPPAAQSFAPSDYASETVQQVVRSLKDASGDVEATFKVYENIAGIITEGTGIGGMVNYKGVQLERGFVADEDTSIYNPGLTLLTESEKERLVEAIIQSRKDGLSKGQWSENNEYAYEYLKWTLDPLHMAELSGFLNFVPIYGAILYLTVLAIQQNFRGLFTSAYLVGVAAFFVPVIALIAAGPQ